MTVDYCLVVDVRDDLSKYIHERCSCSNSECLAMLLDLVLESREALCSIGDTHTPLSKCSAEQRWGGVTQPMPGFFSPTDTRHISERQRERAPSLGRRRCQTLVSLVPRGVSAVNFPQRMLKTS